MVKKGMLGGLLVVALLASPLRAADPFKFPEAKLGSTGELKYVNKIPVLVVSGTPDEIGDAVGALAMKPGARAADYPRDILKHHKIEWAWPLLVRGSNNLFKQFPD